MPGFEFFPNSGETKAEVRRQVGAAREEVAICWNGELKRTHFSPLALKRCEAKDARTFVSGVINTGFVAGVANVRIWSNGSAPKLGLIGIDRKQLWLYVNPDDNPAPVLRLDMPRTADLLSNFWGMVPQGEAARKPPGRGLTEGISSLGKCVRCGSPL